MNPFKAALRSLIAVIPLVATACGDPVGPPDSQSSIVANEPRMLLGLTSLSKKAVEWSGRHVDGTYSASKTIDASGGSISIPQSDFTITFAPGAVASPTAITITALPGDYVAYDMRPHGLRFSAAVTVTQGLRNTEAYTNLLLARSLVGAYVAHDDPPDADGTFVATELLPSLTTFVRNLLGLLVPDKQVWKLNHFSRYMLASG